MTFQQLEYLLAVYRSQSVTLAAKELFVAPSSISISIGKLENELGYPLFTRTQNGLIPTKRGIKVVEYADRICQTYQQLNQIEHEEKKTICINGGHKPTARAFAKLLKEYKDCKDTTFVLTNYSGTNVQNKLLHNEVAVSVSFALNSAIGYWESNHQQAGLHRTVMKIIPAVVCVGSEHPLYNETLIFPNQLRDHVFVDNHHNPRTQSILFRGAVPVAPERILYASTPVSQQEIVALGLAYYITPKPLDCDLHNDKLRYIPLQGVSYYVSATTNPQYPTSPEVSRFLALLDKELQAY